MNATVRPSFPTRSLATTTFHTLTAVVALGLAVGCKSSTDTGAENGGEDAGGSAGESGGSGVNGGGGTGGEPGTGGQQNDGVDAGQTGGTTSGGGDSVYALVTHVYDAENVPTGYVILSHDLDDDDVSLDEAREFPGYASVGAVDGELLVNPSAESLVMERYQITPDLGWTDNGSLSFANEGADAIGFYKQYQQVGGESSLEVDVVGRTLWHPGELELRGEGPAVDLPLVVDGLDLYSNFNRTYAAFDGEVIQPFSYHDADWFFWAPNTRVAVYDDLTAEPRAILDVPCPGLDSITKDEDGNTYLGTWEYSGLYPLMEVGAAPCVARLTPENEIDESWNPDLTALTDGRFILNFRYIGGGKAIAAVLHHEEYGDDYDFVALADQVDEFWALAAANHKLWIFDLEAETAEPMAGIDDFEFINPWFFHSVIDGRVFVFLGDGSSNNSPTSIVYEIDDAGDATRRFEVPGGVIQWVRIR